MLFFVHIKGKVSQNLLLHVYFMIQFPLSFLSYYLPLNAVFCMVTKSKREEENMFGKQPVTDLLIYNYPQELVSETAESQPPLASPTSPLKATAEEDEETSSAHPDLTSPTQLNSKIRK
jgi:hypothetical protein